MMPGSMKCVGVSKPVKSFCGYRFSGFPMVRWVYVSSRNSLIANTGAQMTTNLVSQAATMELNGVPNDVIHNLNPFTLIM